MLPLECRLSTEAARRILYLGLGLAVFLAVCLVVTLFISGLDPVIALALCAIGAIVPGIGYWQLRKAEADRSVKLRIGPEGLFWHGAAGGILAWTAVRRILLLRRTRGGVQMVVEGERSMGIELAGLDASPEQVHAAVKACAMPGTVIAWG